MHIIANSWNGLKEGYAAARESSADLSRRWSPKLQSLSGRMGPCLAGSISRQKRHLFYAIASFVASLTVVLAIVTLPLFIYFIIRYRLQKRENEKLAHPPSPDILPPWWRRLEQGYATIEKDGDIGEVGLIRELALRLPDSHVAIRGMLVDKSLDVDVLILGDTGAWNLESKYWSGELSYRNGKWSRKKSYFLRGGIPHTEYQEMERGFDAQWQKETRELGLTLERRGGKLGAALAKNIKGGLVFTHPEVGLDIASDCPVLCGRANDWLKEVTKSPAVIQTDTPHLLETLDSLIAYSDKFQAHRRSSAQDLARGLHKETDSKLREYEEYCEGWLKKATVSEPSVGKGTTTTRQEIPAVTSANEPAPAAKAPTRRNYWWLFGLTALLAVVAACAVLAVPAAGIGSPKVCAVEETRIYDEPISKARTSGTVGKKGCVLVDAKTTSGWGRITGLTLSHGKWVYLGVFQYDQKEISELPIVKP
jgi:hypothetical protein